MSMRTLEELESVETLEEVWHQLPRVEKKKSNDAGGKRRYRMYNYDSIKAAVALVKGKKMSRTKASTFYKIPKSTLHKHINGFSAFPDYMSVFSANEEGQFVDWVIHMARIGFGRTRQELLGTVQKILKEDGRQLGDWYKGFWRRHPNILAKNPLQLGEWFEKLKEYITVDIEQPDILKDPTRIYSADEYVIPLCSKTVKVFARRASGLMCSSNQKDDPQITVLACGSASGHYMSPLIVYPELRLLYNPLEGFEEACMGRSENGRMDSELFASWLEDIFLPGIEQQRVQRPVLLFVDSHSTHLTIHASNICQANGIELYCLPESSIHVTQPLNFRLVSSLKVTWHQSVRDYQKVNIGDYVTEITFASVFKQAWDRSATTEEATRSFRNAGLFPFDPSVPLSTIKLVPTEVIYPARPQQRAPVPKQRAKVPKQRAPVPQQPNPVSQQHSSVSQQTHLLPKQCYQPLQQHHPVRLQCYLVPQQPHLLPQQCYQPLQQHHPVPQQPNSVPQQPHLLPQQCYQPLQQHHPVRLPCYLVPQQCYQPLQQHIQCQSNTIYCHSNASQCHSNIIQYQSNAIQCHVTTPSIAIATLSTVTATPSQGSKDCPPVHDKYDPQADM